mgnify:CR=1 FL=1
MNEEENVRVDYSKEFTKRLKKCPLPIKEAFRERLDLFLRQRINSQLHDHGLIGKFKGCRSFNVTGDWRAVYREEVSPDRNRVIIFLTFGTHSQLYK